MSRLVVESESLNLGPRTLANYILYGMDVFNLSYAKCWPQASVLLAEPSSDTDEDMKFFLFSAGGESNDLCSDPTNTFIIDKLRSGGRLLDQLEAFLSKQNYLNKLRTYSTKKNSKIVKKTSFFHELQCIKNVLN